MRFAFVVTAMSLALAVPWIAALPIHVNQHREVQHISQRRTLERRGWMNILKFGLESAGMSAAAGAAIYEFEKHFSSSSSSTTTTAGGAGGGTPPHIGPPPVIGPPPAVGPPPARRAVPAPAVLDGLSRRSDVVKDAEHALASWQLGKRGGIGGMLMKNGAINGLGTNSDTDAADDFMPETSSLSRRDHEIGEAEAWTSHDRLEKRGGLLEMVAGFLGVTEKESFKAIIEKAVAFGVGGTVGTVAIGALTKPKSTNATQSQSGTGTQPKYGPPILPPPS